jgi:hypothetical protein
MPAGRCAADAGGLGPKLGQVVRREEGLVPYTAADLDALARCLTLAGRQATARAGTKAWIEEAEGACFHCQREALRLRPIESPPCWILEDWPAVLTEPEDSRSEHQAAEICRRLAALKLSFFEPDPMLAIEAAEKARAAMPGSAG